MNRRLHFAFLTLATASYAAAAQQHPAREPRQSPAGQQARPRQQPNAGLGRYPGEEMLRRLSSMTQTEREQILSQLPPKQRENIEGQIERFQKLPPAQQEKRLEQIERLNALPAARQEQVRQSMRDFNGLPQPRRQAINQELNQLQRMPTDQRQAYIGSEEVIGRFSPEEWRILADRAEILPPK